MSNFCQVPLFKLTNALNGNVIPKRNYELSSLHRHLSLENPDCTHLLQCKYFFSLLSKAYLHVTEAVRIRGLSLRKSFTHTPASYLKSGPQLGTVVSLRHIKPHLTELIQNVGYFLVLNISKTALVGESS